MTWPLLRIATRGSALARWQAERVLGRLGGRAGRATCSSPPPATATRRPRSARDRRHRACSSEGGASRPCSTADADLAVHSAKDLPSETPAGLVLASGPRTGRSPRRARRRRPRDDPHRRRVSRTGSVRRRAQLAAARPDLVFAELRGNIETRLRKRADEGHDAVVVAVAALDRLGLADRRARCSTRPMLLPQAAQGALGGRVPSRRPGDHRDRRRDRRPRRARRGRRRTRLPRRARRRLRPAVRRARHRRRRPASRARRRCSRRSTGASCCGPPGATPTRPEAGRRSRARGPARRQGRPRAVLDVTATDDRLPGRRRARAIPGLLTLRGAELLAARRRRGLRPARVAARCSTSPRPTRRAASTSGRRPGAVDA